jgi:hypothetical protein
VLHFLFERRKKEATREVVRKEQGNKKKTVVE